MSHAIELKKVSKYYAGDDSVSVGFSHVDLELDMGEFVVITGESGSGKSTLLNVISGLDTYEEGQMIVFGEDTDAYGTEEYEDYRKRIIGNIFQDFNLINSYTVYQNIELVMLLSGASKKECKDRAGELIHLVDLDAYRNIKVSKLSGGQKQRVAIARAIAKDVPVIVADEPTGNLDSESAESVLKVLAEVSKDKLVIIVTHNYEQVEPYATRKITMHDGSIVEDKRVLHTDSQSEMTVDQPYESLKREAEIREKAGSPEPDLLSNHVAGKMKKASELRLGVRNTFNLPAKFILLLIVYLFVSTAVLGQYATEKNNMYESDKLGSNPYFMNTNTDRVIIKKNDESNFNKADFAAVKDVENIKQIVKNDIALDYGVSFSVGDIMVEGPVVSIDHIGSEGLTFGHMPQDDYEIVIGIDAASDAYIAAASNGADYIGKKTAITDMKQSAVYDFAEDIRIAGIILDPDTGDNTGYSTYGYSTIYVSEAVSRELLASMMAAASKTEMNFGGKKVNVDYVRTVYSSPDIPDGKAYLFEDEEYYYDNEKALGEDFGLKIKNRFFESEGKYTVDKIITQKNCKKLIGVAKNDYDAYYNCVFISSNDFNKLFDKGYYQISAFMINEQKSAETQQELDEKGFKTLMLKDSLTDSAGELGGVLDLMTYGRLALEFIILFLIAYIVIGLIMRSRRTYYSTLRMLGASKSNTSNIIRTELMLMMLIAYGLVLLFAVSVSTGRLQELTGYRMDDITKLLQFLSVYDYGILGALLLLMSWLISGSFSGRIFAKSAMKTFREEV